MVRWDGEVWRAEGHWRFARLWRQIWLDAAASIITKAAWSINRYKSQWKISSHCHMRWLWCYKVIGHWVSKVMFNICSRVQDSTFRIRQPKARLLGSLRCFWIGITRWNFSYLTYQLRWFAGKCYLVHPRACMKGVNHYRKSVPIVKAATSL